MAKLSLRGLRAQITLIALLPAMAAAVLATMAGVYSMSQLREEQMASEMQAAVSRGERALMAGQVAMRTIALSLALRPNIVQAIERADAPALRALLVPVLAVMRDSDSRLTILEVTDAQGRVLMRGHNPDQSGDDKSHEADVRMALGGQVAMGIAVSPTSGLLSYGAVVPLRRGDTVLGTVRAAGQLNEGLARTLAIATSSEVALFRGRMLRSATLPALTAALLDPALAAGSGARAESGQLTSLPDGTRLLMRLLPLRNMNGGEVGAVILAKSLAGWDAAQRYGLLVMLVAMALVLLAALPLGLWMARRIAAPLSGMALAMRDISVGNLDTAIPGRGRQDEVGGMASALEVFRDELAERQRLQAEADTARRQRERRAVAVDGYTQDFGQSIAGVMRQLEDASTGMKDAAQRIGSAVSQTQERASGTAADAASASESLTAVAAAVEQMAASVAEISRQVARAASIATEAVAEAAHSDERMQSLTRTADRIGNILGVISDVAGRTNLLALNATIEAARAGEAGKGFAVVASEVKALAAQTARATEDVGEQIQAMRLAAGEAATAMHGMTKTIARIDEVATTIAAAVEEQGASTREITGRLQMVTSGTSNASESMASVYSVATDASVVCETVQQAAAAVGEQAATLRQEVEGFLANLRSDTQDRRQFERRPVTGHKAQLEIAGHMVELPIIDISVGGAALRCDQPMAPGASVRITLPGSRPISARVARQQGGVLGLVVSDPASMVEMEKIADQLSRRAA